MKTDVPANPWQTRFAVFAAFIGGFAIPVSTALENIAVALLLLVFLVTPSFRRELFSVMRQPFVAACLVFYAVLLLASGYSSVGFGGAGAMLLKMRDYALVPVIFAVLTSGAARRALLAGFAAGTVLSVVISVGLAAGGVHSLNMLAETSPMTGHPVFLAVAGDWMVFRTHTYHNLFALMLVAGLLALHLNKGFSGKWRWISAAVIVVSLLDIMFLVQGRTIQLLSMLILALVLFLWDRRKGIIVAVCSAIVLLPALYFASGNIRSNLDTIESNVNAYEQGQKETSVGYRLDFYKNSLALIQEKPLLGHGTGSFTAEYRRLTGYGNSSLATNNPHNDYLWFWVEQGVFGIAALLGIIVATVVQARNRAKPEQWTAIALAAAMALGSLGNSLFSDNITRTGFILLACALLAGDSFGNANKAKPTISAE